MNVKTERFEMRLGSEELMRVDDWRRKQRDLPSRSEAVRRLVEQGLMIPAMYLDDMIALAKGPETDARKVIDAKKRSDVYISAAMRFYEGRLERVESDIQSLAVALQGQPHSIAFVLEPVRQYLRQKAEAIRLQAKAAREEAKGRKR